MQAWFLKLLSFALFVLPWYGITVSWAQTQDEFGSEISSRDYFLNPGDVLMVVVYGEPELSRDYPINNHGVIAMPLAGDIEVAGHTAKEVEDEIVAKLKNGYLVNPSVSVEISRFRPFYIMGEVQAPGSYEYSSNLTVLNAAALAGGFTYRANRSDVDIMRDEGAEQKTEYEDVPVEAQVKPGDTIIVKERFF